LRLSEGLLQLGRIGHGTTGAIDDPDPTLMQEIVRIDSGAKTLAYGLKRRLEQPQGHSSASLAIGCRIGGNLQRFAQGGLLGQDLGHGGPTRAIGMEHLHQERPKCLHRGPDPFTPVVLPGHSRVTDILRRKKLS
jgi:hypothetical protein